MIISAITAASNVIKYHEEFSNLIKDICDTIEKRCYEDKHSTTIAVDSLDEEMIDDVVKFLENELGYHVTANDYSMLCVSWYERDVKPAQRDDYLTAEGACRIVHDCCYSYDKVCADINEWIEDYSKSGRGYCHYNVSNVSLSVIHDIRNALLDAGYDVKYCDYNFLIKWMDEEQYLKILPHGVVMIVNVSVAKDSVANYNNELSKLIHEACDVIEKEAYKENYTARVVVNSQDYFMINDVAIFLCGELGYNVNIEKHNEILVSWHGKAIKHVKRDDYLTAEGAFNIAYDAGRSYDNICDKVSKYIMDYAKRGKDCCTYDISFYSSSVVEEVKDSLLDAGYYVTLDDDNFIIRWDQILRHSGQKSGF